MHRRKFVASGVGLIAAAAGQAVVWTFNGMSLRAQPAVAPPIPRSPQGKWVKVAPFPQATGELLGVAINGKLYAAQGLLPGFKPAGLVYEYDPASDAWTQKKPMPHPVHHAAVTALNGKIYVSGGAGPTPDASAPVIRPRQPQRSLSTVEEYDPATNKWRARAPMLTPCNHMGAEAVNGKIYVIGGRGCGGEFIC